MRSIFLAMAAAVPLAACATSPAMWQPPVLAKPTPQQHRLESLPMPGQRVAVAVYGFTDQTGQFKPSDSVQTLSRAVTQGATSILVKALQDASGRRFFTVIEREKLDNVLRERAVIREMRASYLGEKQLNPQALPPLLFAGVLLEGGIIGYDSNTTTGGAGARFLGIGGSTKYREDTVTIYLRAVSTKTGEVLASVSVRKAIASVGVSADAFRYISFKNLLEAEGGISFNEPDQLAMTQAIEKGVYSLIVEGAIQGLWCFQASSDDATAIVTRYVAERDGIDRSDVRLPQSSDGRPANGRCVAGQAAEALPLPIGPLPSGAAPVGAANALPRATVDTGMRRTAPSPAPTGVPNTSAKEASKPG